MDSQIVLDWPQTSCEKVDALAIVMMTQEGLSEPREIVSFSLSSETRYVVVAIWLAEVYFCLYDNKDIYLCLGLQHFLVASLSSRADLRLFEEKRQRFESTNEYGCNLICLESHLPKDTGHRDCHPTFTAILDMLSCRETAHLVSTIHYLIG